MLAASVIILIKLAHLCNSSLRCASIANSRGAASLLLDARREPRIMARYKSRNRPNATGRSETSRFVRLDYRLLSSNAYRSLNPNCRALLIELSMLYNGTNNGSLYLSVRDATHRIGLADTNAASRAFDDLRKLGFIEVARMAHFRIKASEGSRARCWRLTWQPRPGRRAPSWDFMEREPEPKTRSRKSMERGLRVLKAYRKARDENSFPVRDSDICSPFAPGRVA